MFDGISIVATDLDGTLLASDGQISDRSRSALAGAAEAGLVVIVVTARPHRALHELDLRDVHGLAICANGAVMVDLATDAVVATRLLPADDAQRIASDLRAHVPGLAFAVETHDYYGHESHYVNRWPVPDGSPIGSIDQLVSDGVIKMLGRHADITVDRLREIAELVGPSASVTFSEGDGQVEFGPPGVSKASALADVVTAIGGSRADVVAIGDMPNDLPMLEWARVAAAVANAHPDVIDAADLIVPTNDDDGVAYLIDQILRSRATQ